MPRKPVSKQNGLDSRQAVWKVIRELKTFTVPQLRERTTLKPCTVRDYVKGLVAAGYLEQRRNRNVRTPQFKLLKDVGVDAPRVRKDGTPVTMGQGRENMWKIMPILGTFTAKELAVQATTETCQVKVSAAVSYLQYLHKAGYLHKTGNGGYRMLPSAFTGPRPPMIQRTKQVWDPNTNTVRWASHPGETNDQ